MVSEGPAILGLNNYRHAFAWALIGGGQTPKRDKRVEPALVRRGCSVPTECEARGAQRSVAARRALSR